MDKIDVLYVEDEKSLALIVRESLEEHGFRVKHRENGQDAVHAFKAEKPDVIVLDVMMPLMDGFTAAELIRKEDSQIPILFLSALTQTEDVVKGFHLGANDYIRKPFRIEELIVRIEALLKRGDLSEQKSQFPIGHYLLDSMQATLSFRGAVEKLSFREVELLKRLIVHQDKVVAREDIIKAYWKDDTFFTGRSLDVFISRLRKYLAGDERIKIVNVRGVGYMLSIS